MREHFTIGEDIKQFGEDDKEWWEQEGDPLSFHLSDILGQELGFEDEIVDALTGQFVDIADGEISFFDDTTNYVPTPIRPYSYLMEWNYALEDLQQRRRFYNAAAADLFERLFEGVETMQWWNQETKNREGVIWELPQGTKLFRARITDSPELIKRAHAEPFKHVGPPPTGGARAGRMNVEGVVVFYGAMDHETCLAEVRPALGNDTAVITVETTKPLRMLDFVRLRKSFKELSYFQRDFTEQCEKGAFLRKLQTLISQPIIPGREKDYLITQTMTEYLSHMHKDPFEGIIFESAQRSGGINIVLFPDTNGVFPLTYANDSFAIFTTESIKYEHRKGYLSEDGELYPDYRSDDDE